MYPSAVIPLNSISKTAPFKGYHLIERTTPFVKCMLLDFTPTSSTHKQFNPLLTLQSSEYVGLYKNTSSEGSASDEASTRTSITLPNLRHLWRRKRTFLDLKGRVYKATLAFILHVISDQLRQSGELLPTIKIKKLLRVLYTYPTGELEPWTVNVEPPTTSEVYDCICSLKRHRAPGPDDLPPALFKDGGEVLSQRLSDLFACIWEKESVPDNWGESVIVPIFKKGARNLLLMKGLLQAFAFLDPWAFWRGLTGKVSLRGPERWVVAPRSNDFGGSPKELVFAEDYTLKPASSFLIWRVLYGFFGCSRSSFAFVCTPDPPAISVANWMYEGFSGWL
ncbi:hypothetical protein T265_06463 [Opisthorchis viverrini]|uniref:Reverse transcriptase domain-containing protein n=1 Tax=Opisthorchis viverrini TaxID=6198 RepID=A0A075ADT8_OPIVI|nr:hypothetical protein T265_06463 [Opisthorchis viverrini]KER26269.1 hypothetical protein T265_06463 [Opisthorchis viverrini]